MMASGGMRLGGLNCKTLNGTLLKLLIELFHLHIHFVANRLVFEGIMEWFSNRTLGNKVYVLNIRIQGKKTQYFVYGCCFPILHTYNLNHKESDNKYFRLCGPRGKIENIMEVSI